MPVTSTRVIRQSDPHLRFLAAFAANLGRPMVARPRKRTVAWRTGDSLDHVYVYSWHDEPGAPRVTRLAVNHFSLDPSQAVLRSLGFRATDYPGMRRDLHLELTVLDAELDAFADWLPRWITGRVDGTAIPEPPFPCHVWIRGWESADYAWSVAGWDANRAWEKRQEAVRAARRARQVAARARIAGDATSPGSVDTGTA